MLRLMLAFCLWFVGTAPAWAVEAPATTITADRMVVQQPKQTAVFEGQVVLRRERFELKCDRLVVHYDPKNSGQLRQAEAYGHVRIRHDQTTGTAKEARYDQRQGIVTLIGDAELMQPGRTVHGEKIVHDLRTRSTQVQQGGSGRVHLHIDSTKTVTSPPKQAPSPSTEGQP
jgi:lipopolysaccharide export system protein LptA